LDRVLVRVASRFASYNKDDPASFQLPDTFTFLPQFIFYLRRSDYMNTFNMSPDETAFLRSTIMRETVENMMVMIQPSLMEYSLQSVRAEGVEKCEPTPVLLDASSLKKDVILLMDSFFHVVIWSGTTIQSWKDQGFHLKPEFEHVRSMIEQPALDAKDILADRFPQPKYISTHEGGSQARFLVNRVNPSVTHLKDDARARQDSTVVLTEDASLRSFMESLIRHAVTS